MACLNAQFDYSLVTLQYMTNTGTNATEGKMMNVLKLIQDLYEVEYVSVLGPGKLKRVVR